MFLDLNHVLNLRFAEKQELMEYLVNNITFSSFIKKDRKYQTYTQPKTDL